MYMHEATLLNQSILPKVFGSLHLFYRNQSNKSNYSAKKQQVFFWDFLDSLVKFCQSQLRCRWPVKKTETKSNLKHSSRPGSDITYFPLYFSTSEHITCVDSIMLFIKFFTKLSWSFTFMTRSHCFSLKLCISFRQYHFAIQDFTIHKLLHPKMIITYLIIWTCANIVF